MVTFSKRTWMSIILAETLENPSTSLIFARIFQLFVFLVNVYPVVLSELITFSFFLCFIS
jgi:hypothetical protein